MTKARNIADLLDANGDVKSASLDNVPASNDASALTTGTIDNARISLDANEIPNLDTAKITTGTLADIEAKIPLAEQAIADEAQAKIDAKVSGNQKLLDLGLTQAEATALTGYTPPSED